MALSERTKMLREYARLRAETEPENTYYFDMHSSALERFSALPTLEKIAKKYCICH